MRIRVTLLISILLLTSIEFVRGQVVPENAFKAGENIKLIMNFRGMGVRLDVGEAALSLNDGDNVGDRETFHASFDMKTYKFWDVFFKVRDFHESMFYADSLRPIYFHRDVNEGKYMIRNFYWWNEDNSIKATIERQDNAPIDTLFKANATTFDIITLIYFMRSLDYDNMNQGDELNLSFAVDRKVNNLRVVYQGKEKKSIPKGGTFNTVKLSITPVDGKVFQGEQKIILWLSDDLNRLPVFMESPISMGSVQGRLGEYSNLKYPLKSKIE